MILLSEQETADQELMLEAIDLVEMVVATSTIVRRFGMVPIEVHLPAALPVVMANRLQMSQLLGNVFKNAAEAIEASASSVSRSTWSRRHIFSSS